jgi:small subunit ribosomal protein S20
LANHPSALKRARQSERRRLRNKAIKSRIKTAIKSVEKGLEQKDPEKTKELLSQAVSIIQRAASKGVIHKNKASRKVSALMKKAHSLQKAQV